MRIRNAVSAAIVFVFFSAPAFAIPALQLGPGAGDWNYDDTTQTWMTDTNPFSLMAYANSDTADAGGSFAWDDAGATDRYAYLVVSAVPMVDSDLFDVTILNDGAPLAMYASGVGTPPLQDGNSLAPHDIFDTYFEIYQFQFDGSLMTIGDTEPGQTGSGDGYAEEFNVQVNSLAGSVTGLHFDLFVTDGSGVFDPNAPADSDKSLVNAYAPFSHDAQCNPTPNVPEIPEPTTLVMAGLGGLILCVRRRRSTAK